jgi:hypothetical protein
VPFTDVAVSGVSMWKKLWWMAVVALALTGCEIDERDRDDDDTPTVYDYQWRWSADDAQISAGFADYPVGQDAFYELAAAWAALPSPLAGRGYRLSGNNHSDDLFMFAKRKLGGLASNARYQVKFTLKIASNAGRGCVGVGGAPGEGVTVKIGLSRSEPKALQNGHNWIMNIDKGNQTVGGADAIVIGNLATVASNCNNNPIWMVKTMDNSATTFTVSTDSHGELWLLVGSDSGFEATSTFYLSDVLVQAKRL